MKLLEHDPLLEECAEIKKSVTMANSIVKQLLTFSSIRESQLVRFDLIKRINNLKEWLQRLVGQTIAILVNSHAGS